MPQFRAIARKRDHQFLQPRAQDRLVSPTRLMVRHRAVDAHELTGPPLAHQPTYNQVGTASRRAAGLTSFLTAVP